MADRTSKLPLSSQTGPVKELRKTVKTGETLYDGTIVQVLTATPTIVENGGDDANVAFATVCKRGANAGKEALLAHPLSREEYGPFTYGPGSATDALIGNVVTVVDNQTVSTAGVTTNDVVLGRISRIYSATKVYVSLDCKAA